MGEIPDPRGLKARLYPLQALLCVTLLAMVSGADDLMAMFHWGRRLPAGRPESRSTAGGGMPIMGSPPEKGRMPR